MGSGHVQIASSPSDAGWSEVGLGIELGDAGPPSEYAAPEVLLLTLVQPVLLFPREAQVEMSLLEKTFQSRRPSNSANN